MLSLRRNVFRAYWSMSEVWGLMAQFAVENDFEYDAVVLARPDVWFHLDIDLPRYVRDTSNAFLVPID